MSLADAPLEDLADQINTIARLTGTFTLRSGQIATEYFDKYRFETPPGCTTDNFTGLFAIRRGGVPASRCRFG